MCGEYLQCMDHTGLSPAHAFLVYTVQAPNCSDWNCPKQAHVFMPFPGLSCSGSGSRVLHKGTDLVGCIFCALPRCKELRWPDSWWAHCPRWAVCLNHLPGPKLLVSWVFHKSVTSNVPFVSSEELIPGCGPPGRCQLSRIPGRLG